jgi:dihydroorotase
VILEHITTKEAVAFVNSHGPNVAATITAHHLLYNRNAIFEGGLRPHMYV